MTSTAPSCPKCGLNHVVKNGMIHNQKPKYKCKNCEQQFVGFSTNWVVDSHIQ